MISHIFISECFHSLVFSYKSLLFCVIGLCFLYALAMVRTRFASVDASLLLGMDICGGHAHADLPTCAGLQLLEVLQRRRLIRKQVEPRGRIFGKLNPAIGEPVIEPMGGDTEPPSELGDGQIPGHMARM